MTSLLKLHNVSVYSSLFTLCYLIPKYFSKHHVRLWAGVSLSVCLSVRLSATLLRAKCKFHVKIYEFTENISIVRQKYVGQMLIFWWLNGWIDFELRWLKLVVSYHYLEYWWFNPLVRWCINWLFLSWVKIRCINHIGQIPALWWAKNCCNYCFWPFSVILLDWPT